MVLRRRLIEWKVDDLMLAFLCLKNEAAKIVLHVNVQKCVLLRNCFSLPKLQYI